ncbi:hypothetical protein RJ527_08940 [Thalassospiraceae bacterium LMO-SO8]|nr:hypothetical protein [Alphaproteobacteria bacterium LMO-S08]WND77857.1 hypothetical protein RJ527_08940 [Thalassospiraceae bacterium LMO-SO8]
MSDPNESTEEEFYEAIGGAIIIWQNVERECGHLFAHFLVSHNGLGASGVFYHIKNHSTRLQLLDIAARFLFATHDRDDMRDEWKLLSDRIRDASGLRNRIAHFTVDEELTATGWKFWLKPQPWDLSQYDPLNADKSLAKMKSKPLTYSQINAATDQFRELATDLAVFAGHVFALIAPQGDGQP